MIFSSENHHSAISNIRKHQFHSKLSAKITLIPKFMPKRSKSLSQRRRAQKPAIKALQACNSPPADTRIPHSSPRLGCKAGVPTISFFSYPWYLILCYRRYPEHRKPLLVSHIVAGILLLSAVSKWDSITRTFYAVYATAWCLVGISICFKVPAIEELI